MSTHNLAEFDVPRKTLQSTRRNGYLYALGAASIWSGFILVSRLGGISPLLPHDIMAIRYVTCTLIVLPFWIFKFRFNLLDPKLIFCSLIGGLAYALCTLRGFQTTPASHAAVLLPGLMPLFILVLTYVINGEKHHLAKWCGVLVITLGVGSLLWQQMCSGKMMYGGHGWLVASAFCWAVFSVLVKRWNISPWLATIGLAVITCIIYLPVYIFSLQKNITVSSWPHLWQDILIQAFYQGLLATVIQMNFYVKAVQSIGPSSMGTVMSIVPILSGFSALFVFNEPLTPELVVALILVSVGAWIADTTLFQSKGELHAVREY